MRSKRQSGDGETSSNRPTLAGGTLRELSGSALSLVAGGIVQNDSAKRPVPDGAVFND